MPTDTDYQAPLVSEQPVLVCLHASSLVVVADLPLDQKFPQLADLAAQATSSALCIIGIAHQADKLTLYTGGTQSIPELSASLVRELAVAYWLLQDKRLEQLGQVALQSVRKAGIPSDGALFTLPLLSGGLPLGFIGVYSGIATPDASIGLILEIIASQLVQLWHQHQLTSSLQDVRDHLRTWFFDNLVTGQPKETVLESWGRYLGVQPERGYVAAVLEIRAISTGQVAEETLQQVAVNITKGITGRFPASLLHWRGGVLHGLVAVHDMPVSTLQLGRELHAVLQEGVGTLPVQVVCGTSEPLRHPQSFSHGFQQAKDALRAPTHSRAGVVVRPFSGPAAFDSLAGLANSLQPAQHPLLELFARMDNQEPLEGIPLLNFLQALLIVGQRPGKIAERLNTDIRTADQGLQRIRELTRHNFEDAGTRLEWQVALQLYTLRARQ